VAYFGQHVLLPRVERCSLQWNTYIHKNQEKVVKCVCVCVCVCVSIYLYLSIYLYNVKVLAKLLAFKNKNFDVIT
jgi:hypothetical protein